MQYIKPLFDKWRLGTLNLKKIGCVGLFVSVAILTLSMIPHPYHVSYTEINYKKDSHNLTFSIEVFTDDLETAVKMEYKPEKFFLGSELLSDSATLLLEKYISDKTTIIVDGIVLKQLSFLPTESNPDRTIIYFEITDLPNFKSFAFYNEILVNTFTDQQNIVEFIHSGKKEKTLLSKDKTSETWIIGE